MPKDDATENTPPATLVTPLTAEQVTALVVAHVPTVVTASARGISRHSRVCAACGAPFAWSGWEREVAAHLGAVISAAQQPAPTP